MFNWSTNIPSRKQATISIYNNGTKNVHGDSWPSYLLYELVKLLEHINVVGDAIHICLLISTKLVHSCPNLPARSKHLENLCCHCLVNHILLLPS